MSTRGAFGFRWRNTDCLYYSGSDSYPAGLGEALLGDVLGLMMTRTLDVLTVGRMPRVVGESPDGCWSLRERWERRDPRTGNTFMKDSLFCEYAYVLNLDTSVFEVYRGFVTADRAKRGRYVGRKPRTWKPAYAAQQFYYGVTLAVELPLRTLAAYDHLYHRPVPLATLIHLHDAARGADYALDGAECLQAHAAKATVDTAAQEVPDDVLQAEYQLQVTGAHVT